MCRNAWYATLKVVPSAYLWLIIVQEVASLFFRANWKKHYFSQSSNKTVGVIIFLTLGGRVSRLKASNQLSKTIPGTNKLRGKCWNRRNTELATRNCNSQLATATRNFSTRILRTPDYFIPYIRWVRNTNYSRFYRENLVTRESREKLSDSV